MGEFLEKMFSLQRPENPKNAESNHDSGECDLPEENPGTAVESATVVAVSRPQGQANGSQSREDDCPADSWEKLSHKDVASR
jgi:hypothetical protein